MIGWVWRVLAAPAVAGPQFFNDDPHGAFNDQAPTACGVVPLAAIPWASLALLGLIRRRQGQPT